MAKPIFSLQCLGTSSGVPTKARNVSATALVLPRPNSWVLIDCGEGTQHQLLHSNLSLINLDAIFITHVHGDHCYGLPGLIASSAMSGRTSPLIIVGPKEIEDFYLAVKQATQLYTPFEINFIQTADLGELVLGDTIVTACELSHRVTSHAFCFANTTTTVKLLANKLNQNGIPKGPIWGDLQKGKNAYLENGQLIKSMDYTETKITRRKIIISGDNDSPTLLAAESIGADVLMHESTYTHEILLKVGTEPQHSSAKLVAEIPNLLLTHFSARYQKRGSVNGIDTVEDEARQHYKGNLHLAEDFDHYELLEDGSFNKVNNPSAI